MQSLLNKLQLSTIGIGLIVLLTGVGCLVAGSAYHTFSQVQTISRAWNNLGQRILPKSQNLYEMRVAMGYGGAIHKIKNMVLRLDLPLGQQANEDLDRLQHHMSAYRKLGTSEEEYANLAIIQSMVNAYRLGIDKAQSMMANGSRPADIDDAIKYNDGPALTALARLNTAIVQEHETAQSGMDFAVVATKEFTKMTAIVVMAALIIFSLLMIYFIRWRIIRPLNSLAEHVKHIGNGDLTRRITLYTHDEVGILASAVNEMTEGLQKLTKNAREASHQLSSLASQTLATTSEQASSVEEQFASIQQVAATVSEIVESGEQMASKAQDVLLQARATIKKGENGLHSVEAMVEAMNAIRIQTEFVTGNIMSLNERTQAIGDIIASVTDIAQRSELLALNAAIEAAAAGEQGRSFSVVADEIKSMADQSKSATAQITDILRKVQDGINKSVMLTEESVKRVESGKVLSEDALSTITEMTESIRLSIGAFELSVSANNQQRVGLDQVAQALQHIRLGGEQTALSTRQMESAVNDITNLTSQIDQSIKGYAA